MKNQRTSVDQYTGLSLDGDFDLGAGAAFKTVKYFKGTLANEGIGFSGSGGFNLPFGQNSEPVFEGGSSVATPVAGGITLNGTIALCKK